MKKSKTLCAGCRDNFYNGNNPYGVSECRHFDSAEVVKRRKIPADLRPPYLGIKEQITLSCHHPSGYVMVPKEALDSKGFWKR